MSSCDHPNTWMGRFVCNFYRRIADGSRCPMPRRYTNAGR